MALVHFNSLHACACMDRHARTTFSPHHHHNNHHNNHHNKHHNKHHNQHHNHTTTHNNTQQHTTTHHSTPQHTTTQQHNNKHHNHTQLMLGCGFSWLLDLVNVGLVIGRFLSCPLSLMFTVALNLPWCRYLAAHEGVQPQLYADNLRCVSWDPHLLLNAARFTTVYVRLVGQEPAPSKCVLLSTSKVVRKDMKDWELSQEGDRWSVKFDVRDLGAHLDTAYVFACCSPWD